ncbi:MULTISPECIES: peptidoglycan DD-metalloendopeptidase family protein [Sporosarcina]|uniref:Peptidoglycan DD-metalloendopeptidase family protein n=1 Tax=Sporosarcina saromensis TaxID=359365 RepID=A0ABU4G9W5_9BACL|nr:peptidoglycan DD-metalloendopeptidase family protein [Sporosarcina saromensis]MDW0112372.1 peptidoglycan DD-metalloendopeptidase family protein [Sporosarcina saromensis]
MKWKTKWILAILLAIGVFSFAKLEEMGVVNKPITQYITTGKDFIVMKKWVSSLIDNDDEDAIVVSAEPVEELPFAAYESMQPYKDGVIVSYTHAMPITAQGDGLVVFTGSTRQSGKTVTVLYDDGDEVTYGFVGSIQKLPYSTVKKGDTLALMDEEAIYLKVKREGVILEAGVLATYFSDTNE